MVQDRQHELFQGLRDQPEVTTATSPIHRFIVSSRPYAAVAHPARAQAPNTATVVVLSSTDWRHRQGCEGLDDQLRRASGAGRRRAPTAGPTIAGAVVDGRLLGPGCPNTDSTADDGTTSRWSPGKPRRACEHSSAGEKSEVTVYGRKEGVRADAQIGQSLDSATIDETPILGRKVSESAGVQRGFPHRGRAPATCSSTRRSSSRAAAAAARRRSCSTAASNDEGWGRQTMMATRADRRDAGNDGALQRVLGGVRLDRRSRDEHRNQVRRQPAARRRRCFWADRRLAGEDNFAPRVSARRRSRPASRRRRCRPSIPRTCRTHSARCPVHSGRRSSRTRRSSS